MFHWQNSINTEIHAHTVLCSLSCFRLKVKSAKLSDSGNYSCLPTTAEGDSVTVHIINGNHRSGGGSFKRNEWDRPKWNHVSSDNVHIYARRCCARNAFAGCCNMAMFSRKYSCISILLASAFHSQAAAFTNRISWRGNNTRGYQKKLRRTLATMPVLRTSRINVCVHFRKQKQRKTRCCTRWTTWQFRNADNLDIRRELALWRQRLPLVVRVDVFFYIVHINHTRAYEYLSPTPASRPEWTKNTLWQLPSCSSVWRESWSQWTY